MNKAHIPEDSELMQDILAHENLDFLWMNMQCTPLTAGKQVPLTYKDAAGETSRCRPAAPILGENGQPAAVRCHDKQRRWTAGPSGSRRPSPTS